MRKHAICLCLVLGISLCGCGKAESDETEVPQVKMAEISAEEQETGQIENDPENEENPVPIETENAPGTLLGEEEVILMEEGQAVAVSYTRIQGMEDFTIAYDPDFFTFDADEKELRFDAVSYGKDSSTPVFVRITETDGDSVEALADQYVSESNEECLTEEVTIGEGEYPAIWVNYAEGTDASSRTCDMYVLRYNEKLYVVQMDCFVEAYESLGAVQESILSTLRFDEG